MKVLFTPTRSQTLCNKWPRVQCGISKLQVRKKKKILQKGPHWYVCNMTTNLQSRYAMVPTGGNRFIAFAVKVFALGLHRCRIFTQVLLSGRGVDR